MRGIIRVNFKGVDKISTLAVRLLIMYDRTEEILKAVIKEFRKSGKPVSSSLLYKKYGFGVKPATIRRELHGLTKRGYLRQVHTSGGRVPTNKGYQFIADDALKNLNKIKKGIAIKQIINQELGRLIEELSDQLKVLGVGYQPKEKEIYKSGIDDLFYQLLLENRDDILEVLRDFEMLEKRIDAMIEEVAADGHGGYTTPKVFIGKSPVTRSRHLSVIADMFEGKDGAFLLMVIGPTRMNYEEILRKFRELK